MILLIKVLGLVQGVGYRPFVARLAEKLGISGSVRNSGGIVYILAAGSRDALESFTGSLSSECPPGADVAQVLTVPAPEGTEIPSGFQIIRSSEDAEHTPVLPPDLPMTSAEKAGSMCTRKANMTGFCWLKDILSRRLTGVRLP